MEKVTLPFLLELCFMSKQHPRALNQILCCKQNPLIRGAKRVVCRVIGWPVQVYNLTSTLLLQEEENLQNTRHITHLIKPTKTKLSNKFHTLLQVRITSLSPLKHPHTPKPLFLAKHGQFYKSQATIQFPRAFCPKLLQTHSNQHT